MQACRCTLPAFSLLPESSACTQGSSHVHSEPLQAHKTSASELAAWRLAQVSMAFSCASQPVDIRTREADNITSNVHLGHLDRNQDKPLHALQAQRKHKVRAVLPCSSPHSMQTMQSAHNPIQLHSDRHEHHHQPQQQPSSTSTVSYVPGYGSVANATWTNSPSRDGQVTLSPPAAAQHFSRGTAPQSATTDDRPSSEKGPTKTLQPRPNPPKKIPRPPNSWILYRSDKIREYNASLPEGASKATQAYLSKHFAEMWKKESDDVRADYERQAEAVRDEHELKYPGE